MLARMDGDLVERPRAGRTFTAHRRVRLDDMDETGRVRLDALARFMQDAAIDDVDETGWGAPPHLWFVRRIRVDVVRPLLTDRALEVVTWCSGSATAAAGRRWTITGDAGGLAEVESVWIHLGPDARPARIEGFGVYEAAAGGRTVSTRVTLPGPPAGAPRSAWPLRRTDVDLHGHVNNAVVWHAVEDVLAPDVDLARPLSARVDFQRPLDGGDGVHVVRWDDGATRFLALETAGGTHAVTAVTPS
jgi:acyl-ACP thioesterase